eukprot:TRINITY_DN7340_c0_g1_i1.p1 TRINITY_DN7340_c0_g1~~TRINITY_DN7340_c0_g1_i1.p1  ORF type:complete len:281 (+),score=63.46 TRINITY_DN7340_c0_g1_i1:128-970(+)
MLGDPLARTAPVGSAARYLDTRALSGGCNGRADLVATTLLSERTGTGDLGYGLGASAVGSSAGSALARRSNRSGGGSGVSEDCDEMSSVSTKVTDARLSVPGLRESILRGARSERNRCLEAAEAERNGRDRRGGCSVATQTEAVFVMSGPEPSEYGGGAVASTVPSSLWTKSDADAQAEALRTIQMLGSRGNSSSRSEGMLAELEAEIQAERSRRQELERLLERERRRTEAAQQQVLTLEYELDGKESALQVADRALENRNVELQQVQMQLMALQGGYIS